MYISGLFAPVRSGY